MASITENLFIEYTKKLNISQIKHKINRQRLKFSLLDISYYLYCIFLITDQNKALCYVYKNYFSKQYKTKYSTFAHNINTFSVLLEDFFVFTKKKYHIKKTEISIVDTTLIEEKKSCFINQKDYTLNRVTKRQNNLICGSKGLIFCNDKKQVYFVNILNINESDQNILKNSAQYLINLPKFLLADRGFNNKKVKERLMYYDCYLISPNHYKTVLKTGQYFDSDEEKKLYKVRWKIEEIFKTIKQNQSEFPLNLKGKYTNKLKKAKMFITITSYNLSTL